MLSASLCFSATLSLCYGVTVDRSNRDGIFWNLFSDPFYPWVGCPLWKNGQPAPYKRTSGGKSVKPWQILLKLFFLVFPKSNWGISVEKKVTRHVWGFWTRGAQNGVTVDGSNRNGIFWNSFSDPSYPWVGCPFWKNGQATPYKRTSKGKSVKVWQI